MQFDVKNYGEKALLIQFKEEISLTVHQQVKYCFEKLKQMNIDGIQSLIPAYNSITIVFDIFKTNQKILKAQIIDAKFNFKEENHLQSNVIEIPVCYDEKYGLDIDYVSETLQLSKQEIINIHTEKPYLVYMLGFSPGFMYLGGLNKKLTIPRKQNPRLRIPVGAVGLADQQTGVYPIETPGGWQIIGQTPLPLFTQDKTSLVQMGDYVKFTQISKEEFEKIKQA